jgi:hypothetical protein
LVDSLTDLSTYQRLKREDVLHYLGAPTFEGKHQLTYEYAQNGQADMLEIEVKGDGSIGNLGFSCSLPSPSTSPAKSNWLADTWLSRAG